MTPQHETPQPEIRFVWIDVDPYLANGQRPVYMLERQLAHGTNPNGGVFNVAQVARLGEFWVPQAPLLPGADPDWSVVKTGDHVKIPVTAYRCDRALASVFALGLQLGLLAAGEFVRRTLKPPEAVYLVLGHTVTDLGDGFRCYAGVALRSH
jgi:hypothetical protein